MAESLPPEWNSSPLYQFMKAIFPAYSSCYDRLNVRLLGSKIGRSHEAIYRWIRSGQLNSRNAVLLCREANEEPNLSARGGNKITIEEFHRFVYAGL